MPIVINQNKNGYFVIRATASESYIVAGNTSVSNLATADDILVANSGAGAPGKPYAQTEPIVVGAQLTRIKWTTNGEITIKRGANLKFDLFNNGDMDLREGLASNNATTDDTSANLVITMTGNGTIILEGKKNVTFVSEY